MYPKYLYKFRPFNHLTIMSLTNNYHWLSNPTDFNDPFDCQVKLQFDEIPPIDYVKKFEEYNKKTEEGGNYIVPTKEELYTATFKAEASQFSKDIEDSLKNELAILSLSEGFDNTTMWSHYADSHNGICIRYEPRLSYCKQVIPDNLFQKVKYRPPNELTFNVYELIARCGHDTGKYNEVMYELATTKSIDWVYEKEWRMFSNNKGVSRYCSAGMTAIYFGLRCGTEEKKTIRNMLSYRPMMYFQMIRSQNGMTLEEVFMDEKSKYWNE